MFSSEDIYFVLDKNMQNQIFYKNKIFYGYCLKGYCPLDEFYNKDFVYMSKISYFIRRKFKKYNEKLLKQIFIYLDFIAFCEIQNINYNLKINYKKILNKKDFTILQINKYNKLFIENKEVHKILLKLINERNKIEIINKKCSLFFTDKK